jgi:hypothetical protein
LENSSSTMEITSCNVLLWPGLPRSSYWFAKSILIWPFFFLSI